MGRRRGGPPSAGREREQPPERCGWKLYQWREFGRALAELVAAVEGLQRDDPRGYRSHPATKRLFAIYRLVTEVIPGNPGGPEFQIGNTMGPAFRHWRSAGFYERHRLFFRFRSDAHAIVFAWVNDEEALRARGARTDAYSVFSRMLRSGRPPSDWEALLEESDRLRLPAEDE